MPIAESLHRPTPLLLLLPPALASVWSKAEMDSSKGNKEKQGNKQPPPGYPTRTAPQKKPCCPRTKKKDDKSFIEGCLAALCCCWLCEVCCD